MELENAFNLLCDPLPSERGLNSHTDVDTRPHLSLALELLLPTGGRSLASHLRPWAVASLFRPVVPWSRRSGGRLLPSSNRGRSLPVHDPLPRKGLCRYIAGDEAASASSASVRACAVLRVRGRDAHGAPWQVEMCRVTYRMIRHESLHCRFDLRPSLNTSRVIRE